MYKDYALSIKKLSYTRLLSSKMQIYSS